MKKKLKTILEECYLEDGFSNFDFDKAVTQIMRLFRARKVSPKIKLPPGFSVHP